MSIFARTIRTRGLGRIGLILICLVALAGAVAAVVGGPSEPEDTGGRWEITPLADATPNGCHLDNQRCAEWCTLYQGGGTQGSGLLCCVPYGALATGGDLDDCQGLRRE